MPIKMFLLFSTFPRPAKALSGIKAFRSLSPSVKVASVWLERTSSPSGRPPAGDSVMNLITLKMEFNVISISSICKITRFGHGGGERGGVIFLPLRDYKFF